MLEEQVKLEKTVLKHKKYKTNAALELSHKLDDIGKIIKKDLTEINKYTKKRSTDRELIKNDRTNDSKCIQTILHGKIKIRFGIINYYIHPLDFFTIFHDKKKVMILPIKFYYMNSSQSNDHFYIILFNKTENIIN
jgi:hypothetical protein